MNHRRSKRLPAGTLFMVLVIGLVALGVGYGLWSRTLFIKGIVNTGNVNARFQAAFTDDDGKVDLATVDGGDTGNCPIQAGGNTSCDPAASGADPKARHDKDVAQCIATVGDGTTGTIAQDRAYPGYFCTAWFEIVNNGTVPVKIASARVNGQVVTPSLPVPFDLTGDGKSDVAVHLTGIDICQQIDPNQRVLMDVDQQVLQDAPQGASMTYLVEVQLNQWNEECTPPQVNLPVFTVSKAGLTQTQAAALGSALGIPSDQLVFHNGVALFTDPARFQAVPMTAFGTNPLGNEDRLPTTLEAFDFAAMQKIVPLDGKVALERAHNAYAEAGIVITDTVAMISHSTFEAVDTKGSPIIQNVRLDTQVSQMFSLRNIPLIGPGAQVSVNFGPDGKVTQLTHSFFQLAEGQQVRIVSAREAAARCAALYPGLQAQFRPTLAYYAPPLSMGSVNTILPYFDCNGTAAVGKDQLIPLQRLVPAVLSTDFVPTVNLAVEAKGRTINAQAAVQGGKPPYSFSWGSSSTDLSGFGGDQSEIQYNVEAREQVSAETVHVVVTDANGVEAQASQTVALPPVIGLFGPQALKVLADPLRVGGVTDFGIERAVSDMCAGNISGYSNRMDDKAFKRFHWTGASAWERDFKESSDHNAYVDNVDQTFYCGHGWGGGFTFESNQDDGALEYPDPRISPGGDWGDLDLEWLALLSCQVLKGEHNGLSWASRWGPAFDGLHLLLGFETNAYDWSSFAGRFADYQLGRKILFFELPPLPVRAAWFQAAREEQPSGVKAVVMGVIGPNGLANYNDYFWGQGPVGPDIPRSSIIGYWRVVVTIP